MQSSLLWVQNQQNNPEQAIPTFQLTLPYPVHLCFRFTVLSLLLPLLPLISFRIIHQV